MIISARGMKKRKGFWLDIGFASSYPLVVIFGLLVASMKKNDGGSAFGGKIENGQYFVLSDNGTLQLVGKIEWIINLLLSCFVLLLGFIGIIGFAYFTIKYFFYPQIKKLIKGKSLY